MKELAQVNVKIDAGLHRRFNTALQVRGHSQRDIVERAIEVYVNAANSTAILHLDGSLCPLNEMVLNLTRAVRDQINASHTTVAADVAAVKATLAAGK